MNKERLKIIRKELACFLAEKTTATDASLKKCLNEVIAELDCAIEKNDGHFTTQKVLDMVGKILDKLPFIVSLFEKLK